MLGRAPFVADTRTAAARALSSSGGDYFDIRCPLVELVALWPSEPNQDGSTPAPFHGTIASTTKASNLLPAIIVTSALPSVFGALNQASWGTILPTGGFSEATVKTIGDYLGPFVQMSCGTINTVLGSVYSAKNDAGTDASVGIVLGNFTFVCAPLATKVRNETTGDLSSLVKLVVDAVANIGAAVLIAEAISLPTP